MVCFPNDLWWGKNSWTNNLFYRFLLKYISRDEVGLLGKGNGGLVEVEEVVNRFEEQSPLYGFIQYRRRKVILKYMPEGTSRLLQGQSLLFHWSWVFSDTMLKSKTARVHVQFQSVVEKLSPHDTIFPFAQSADLRDSALSSACSLHTATASIKSSNDSLPQKGLAEITEDASESRADTVEGSLRYGGVKKGEEHVESAQDWPEKVNGSTSVDRTHHRSTSTTTQNSFRSRTTSNTDKPLPPPPEDHARDDMSPGPILDYGDFNTRPSMDGRFSSNSTRPSTKDLYDAYGYKKKMKMGPRPSTDSVGPPDSSGTRLNDFRPVSTLPAGLRMPSRKAVPARPTSRQAQTSPPNQTSTPVKPNPPARANSSEKLTPKKAPTAPVAPIHIPDRKVSTQSNGLRTPRMPEPGSPKMTPEKQRLMKALQLRQKQMAAQSSVSDIGIRNTFEDPDFVKPEIDDSILGAVIDASKSTEGHEQVSIAIKDLSKERNQFLEDSPISMPETTEEPSTQASSITDDEEAEAQKRQENHSTSIPSVSDCQDLSSISANDSYHQLTDRQEVASADSEKGVHVEDAVIENPKRLTQSSALMQSELFGVGEDVAKHETTGSGLPEPARDETPRVIDNQSLHGENIATADELDDDKQLLPSQLLGSQAPKSPSIFGHAAPFLDRKGVSPAKFDENGGIQQNGPLNDHEKIASVWDVSKAEDLSQSQILKNDDRIDCVSDTDNQERVLRSQCGKSDGQSRECSNEVAPRDAPNELANPLVVGQSSSLGSVTTPFDSINAHEVPLPPIDEDEAIRLSPQRTLFHEDAAMHRSQHTDDQLRPASPQAEFPSQGSDHLIEARSTLNSNSDRHTERQSCSQGAPKPVTRVSSPDHSEEHYLSDDSFMEELKSATVQEAKPVSVSKSPIKPVFSRSESEQRLNGSAKASRSVSTPVNYSAKDGAVLSSPRPPTPLSTPRSFSAQHDPRPDVQQSHVPISKKIGVSSSISQRIKALEQLSSRPTSPTSPKLAPNTPTFLGLRSASLRTSSGGSEYKNSSFNKNRSDTAYPSPSPSPEINKASPLTQANIAKHSHPTKPATPSIIRDAIVKSLETPSDPSEGHHMEVQERPLQLALQKASPPVEHNLMGPPPLSPLKPPRPRFGRYSSTRSGSSSSNEQKLEHPTATRRDSFASIRSKSSRAGSEVELPRTISDSSLSGLTSLDGTQDEKKDSRRSRLLKRMSSISSMSRRTIAHALSPSPKEAPIIERQEPTPEPTTTSVDLGDINIQFPDTLVSSPLHLILISAHTFFSSGRDDTWSLTRKVSWSSRHPKQTT